MGNWDSGLESELELAADLQCHDSAGELGHGVGGNGECRDAIEDEIRQGNTSFSEIQGEGSSLRRGRQLGSEEEAQEAFREGIGEGRKAVRDGETSQQNSMKRVQEGGIPEDAFDASSSCKEILDCRRRKRDAAMLELDLSKAFSKGRNEAAQLLLQKT